MTMTIINLLGEFKMWRWLTRKWAGWRWYYVDDGRNDPMWLFGWKDTDLNGTTTNSWYSLHPAGIMLMQCEGSRPWKNSMIEIIEK